MGASKQAPFDEREFLLPKNKLNNFGTLRGAVNTVFSKIYKELRSGGTETVQELILDDVTDTTTAVSAYGINVVETVTETDFCCRLPAPVIGRSVTFINKTITPFTVFPSSTGGSINGNIDGNEVITGNYKPYTFYCIDNPLPGSWMMSSPAATSQIGVPNLDPDTSIAANYIEIPHTNGVSINISGFETSVMKVGGVGLAIQGQSLPLCGYLFDQINNAPTYMRSEPVPTKIVKFKLYTNILVSDVVGLSGAPFTIYLGWTYQQACNGSTNTIQMYSVTEDPNNGSLNNTTQEVIGGILNSPIEVGDKGTLYQIIEPGLWPNSTNPHFGQIGSNVGIIPGITSDYWWTPHFEIDSNVPTKDYQFKIIMEITQ